MDSAKPALALRRLASQHSFEMDVTEIKYGSPEYQACLQLREATLRRPIGLELSAADLAGESKQLHFAALENGEVLGCVLIKPLQNRIGQLRQMAVSPEQQGRSIGRLLIEYLESSLSQKGFAQIDLDARTSARGFYQKLGYTTTSATFEHLGIEHIRMSKLLPDQR